MRDVSEVSFLYLKGLEKVFFSVIERYSLHRRRTQDDHKGSLKGILFIGEELRKTLNQNLLITIIDYCIHATVSC